MDFFKALNILEPACQWETWESYQIIENVLQSQYAEDIGC